MRAFVPSEKASLAHGSKTQISASCRSIPVSAKAGDAEA